MSKFKINEKVVSKETGKVGVVRVRNVAHEGKTTTVEYLVDFGGNMAEWKIMKKNELQKVHNVTEKSPFTYREYSYGDQKLVMVACVEPKVFWLENNSEEWYDPYYERKGRKLSIAYSIYNGVDDYNIEIGIAYAKHRLKKNPFCTMESTFGGEFNAETVEAIMNVKADYIKRHWSEFYRPRN